MLGLVARFGCLKMEQCWPWICYIIFFSDRLHDSSASPLLSNRQLCSLLPSKVPESRKVPTSTGSFHQENVLNRWRLKNLDSHGPGYAMNWCMLVGFASVHIIINWWLSSSVRGWTSCIHPRKDLQWFTDHIWDQKNAKGQCSPPAVCSLATLNMNSVAVRPELIRSYCKKSVVEGWKQ